MPAGIMKFSTVPVRRFKSEKNRITNPNANRMTMRYRGNGGWIVTLGLGELVRQRRFERYVVLENREHPGEIKEIFDERGSLLCRN